MPGHMTELEKNKKYYLVAEAGRNPSNGKRKRITKTYKGTKKQAQNELSRMELELEKGTYIQPSKLTFGKFCKDWMEDYGKIRLSPTTHRRYDQILRLRVIP